MTYPAPNSRCLNGGGTHFWSVTPSKYNQDIIDWESGSCNVFTLFSNKIYRTYLGAAFSNFSCLSISFRPTWRRRRRFSDDFRDKHQLPNDTQSPNDCFERCLCYCSPQMRAAASRRKWVRERERERVSEWTQPFSNLLSLNFTISTFLKIYSILSFVVPHTLPLSHSLSFLLSLSPSHLSFRDRYISTSHLLR